MANIPVVLFGDYIAAYGVIRALGPKSIPIYIVSQDGKGICTHSRYVKKTLTLSAADGFFINKLKDWISQNVGPEAVLMIAGDDQYLDILSQNHASLEPNLKCTFPPWHVVKKVRNKRETYKIAESIGIPIPQTHFIESESELKEIISKGLKLKYPLLMKSEKSKEFVSKYKTKGVVSNNEKEIFDNYTKYEGFMGELLLQEMIPGDENKLLNFIGIYNKEADPIQIFMNRKRRTSGQFSSCTLMETMWSQDVLNYSNRLIKEIGYYGYANPEFKYDVRDGQLKLMEINGRISMSNSHALRCGLNIIESLYGEALNESVKSLERFEQNYSDNILWLVPVGDFMAVFKMFRNRTLSLPVYFKSLSGTGYIMEPINVCDPAVFLFEVYAIIRLACAKIIKKNQ